MDIKLRTEEKLLREIRVSVADRVPRAIAQARGALHMLMLRTRAEGTSEDTSLIWTLRAQVGSMEKLLSIVPEAREPSTVELLAGARNLFENLVWLRLFLLDASYGDFFYGQLLKNQREDLSGMISKLKGEAALFESMEAEDSACLTAALDELKADALAPEKAAALVRLKLDGYRADLGKRTRRQFVLYAAAAALNSYGYQRHLLLEKQIPHWQSQLDLIDCRIEDLKLRVADPARSSRYLGQWQWRNEAQRVGMAEQYDFLYRLTSRLLHSTPMNIVTEKELTDGERITLLEYIAISVEDAIDAVEAFSFPGRVDAIFLEIPGTAMTADEN